MPDHSPALLVGNSLAVLVAAHELVRLGRSVVLLTDGKPLGGHFAGVRIEGHDFDVGMVMLERPSRGEDSRGRIIDYRPEVRNDWTRFSSEVAAWMDEWLALRRVPTPTVTVNGRYGPDYLIANRLDLLVGTACGAVEPLRRADPYHAANKNNCEIYDHLSYGEAARLHHGGEWHAQYVEPFVRKLLDVGSDEMLARFHRAAWAPLYYPETLAAAHRAKFGLLPEYPFYTTESGFVGGAVAAMARAVEQTPGSCIVREPLQEMRYANGVWHVRCDSERWVSSRIVVGLTLDRCQGLLQLPTSDPLRSASVALMFALVRSADIAQGMGCHMVVDDSFVIYRVSDQDHLAGLDPEWHRVVVEACPRSLAARTISHPSAADQAVLVEELCRLMGLPSADSVRVLKNTVARNALVVPTVEAVAQFHMNATMLAEAMPNAMLTSTLLGYGVASFNDQLVQGIRAAKDLT